MTNGIFDEQDETRNENAEHEGTKARREMVCPFCKHRIYTTAPDPVYCGPHRASVGPNESPRVQMVERPALPAGPKPMADQIANAAARAVLDNAPSTATTQKSAPMGEQFDFPRELRCDAVMLEKSHPYTADMLNRAAVEIEKMRATDAKRFKLFQARNEEIERLREGLRQLLNDKHVSYAVRAIRGRKALAETAAVYIQQRASE